MTLVNSPVTTMDAPIINTEHLTKVYENADFRAVDDLNLSLIHIYLSMRGPSTGETTAKGANVNNRYNSTLLLASSGETEKNSDPASDTVTNVSPAFMICLLYTSRCV